MLGWLLAALAVMALAPAAAAAAPGDVALVGPGAEDVALSADGGVVAVITSQRLDPAEDHEGVNVVYVGRPDGEGGMDYTLISRGTGGQNPNESSRGVDLSADGSTVAFFSYASNLVAGDTNGRQDVFVAATDGSGIRRANVSDVLGEEARDGSVSDHDPSLSADGSRVAFTDSARLTDDAPLGTGQLVYVRDLDLGTTRMAGQGRDAAISGDGLVVAYQGDGNQLYADEGGDADQIVSVDADGTPGDLASGEPDLDHDGSLIAFNSSASNLTLDAEDNPGPDIFLRDRDSARTELVSLDDRNEPATGSFAQPSLSDSGRFVAFIALGDPNGCGGDGFHVALRDRTGESTFRASRTFEGGLPDGPSGLAAIGGGPSVSAGGTLVAWPSWATNILEAGGGDPGAPDAFTTELGAGIEDPDLFTPAGEPRAAEDAGELVFDVGVCRRAGRQTESRPVFATEDGTASAGDDYTPLAGEETVVPGTEDRVEIPVGLLDDGESEPWESLYLTGAPGTVVEPRRARGFITDDDLPAQGPIYYEAGGSIVALDPGAQDPRPVTTGSLPAVSRDGQRLAFVRPGMIGDELWVADADGSNARSLEVSGPSDEGPARPAWSPDGTKVAWMVANGETELPSMDIVLVDPGTGDAEPVYVALEAPGETLSFSPDGETLALSAGTPSEVLLLDIATQGLNPLTVGRDPSYGPGGELVFERSGDLYLLPDENGTPARTATERASGAPDTWDDARPAFSPDGLAIVYERDGSGTGRWIETLNLTPGSPPAALTPFDGDARNPAWAPETGPPPPPTLSVADASVSEGGTLSFTVRLSREAEGDVTVTAATAPGSATSPADFTARSTQLVIPAGERTATFDVATAQDTVDEADETITVTLSAATGAPIGDGTATGTILDDDPAPTLSIGDASAPEGSPVELPITLSAPSERDVSVRLDTTSGTAQPPGDYTARTGVLVEIPAGETDAEVAVATIADTLDEGDETFTATLSMPVNATLGDATATATIQEGTPVASVGAASADESAVLRFPVSLSRPATEQVTLTLATQDGTAVAGPIGDYAATTTTLTFAQGESLKHFEVTTRPDGNTEPDETLTARITGSTGRVTLGQTSATGTIRDVTPRLTIDNATADEGDKLRFAVRLSRPSSTTITARFRTEDGTAVAGPIGDYAAVTTDNPTALVFTPGTTELFFEVTTRPDGNTEPDETLTARLISGAGFFATPQFTATGTIRDATPRLTIDNAIVNEGGTLRFAVKLSRPSPTTITARFRTEDGTAVAPGDYTSVPTASPTALVFTPGTTQLFFEVATVSDSIVESDETLTARLISGAGFFATPQFTATGTIEDASGPIPIERGGKVGATLVAGTIKVKPPGAKGFVDVGAQAGIPVGSLVDASEGIVEILGAVSPKGKLASAAAAKVQRARLSRGVFRVRQGKRSPLVTFALAGKGCKRALTADGKGAFAVKGRFATGRIGKARWTTTDSCLATTVKVARGTVRVGRKAVRAGRSVTVRRR